MMIHRSVLCAGAAYLLAVIVACQSPSTQLPGITLDTTRSPGEDFYQYVNGKWMQENPIPAEYSRWGAFTQLRNDNTLELKSLVESIPASATGDDAKLRTFYLIAMDQATRDAQGTKAIDGELARIAALESVEDLANELGHLRSMGMSPLFGFSVGPDEKKSDEYAVHLHQGGLGLPERAYYLGTTDDSKKIRAAYREHIAAMLQLLGDSAESAGAQADTILEFETKLAEASRTPVQLRDAEANYNKKTLAELNALTPRFKWPLYLRNLSMAPFDTVIVEQPEFFEKLNGLLASAPMADWKVYLRWQLIHGMASALSSPFENESFRFYSGVMRGVTTMQPQWKRAVGTLDHVMGDALGRLYVQKYFTSEAKARMDRMVKNLLVAYKERIETRDWMGPETKQQALSKLAAIQTKIGYPDSWRDYAGLTIQSDSHAANTLRSMAFESAYRLGRLGKPVDRKEWHMTPPTVNAYYSENMNEIVFPAGILQPPFFDPKMDDAINYGGIGAVIGHEITHGFDDQGSHIDAQGNLRNWWTPEDRARFNAKTEKLAQQYDACMPLPDVHVNGRLTLGENLADMGGVTIAFAAYQKSLAGKPSPVIDGLTGEQRFFIGYAQVWRDNVRDADVRLQVRTDPHSPGRFRALVPLSNFQPFYDAFGIKPGEAMYRKPEDRVEVW